MATRKTTGAKPARAKIRIFAAEPGVDPLDRRLFTRISTRIDADDRKSAHKAVAAFVKDARGTEGGEAMARLIESKPVVAAFLEGVFGTSPYLTELATRDPNRLARILKTDPQVHVDALIARTRALALTDERALMRELRQIKAEAALTIGLADLAGAWTLFEVTTALARLADATLSATIRFLFAQEVERGRWTPVDPSDLEKGCGYVVLAMGKHGAFELNYSSDVDLIILFDRDVIGVEDKSEATTFFVRFTKRLVNIMQERNGDGYVFRVDLRLRPDPGATPIAISTEAALNYYEALGQNWERAALIKARACAGDIEAGERFLREIRPFIWRKYFDYAAIKDVHSIKRQIHAHRGYEEIALLGHNVKLGRGGIREIEFFVQTQQLIAGGRNPALRGRETVPMLNQLVDAGWIRPEVRDQLTEAYDFLRRVEHRIQMVADEQTHNLPEDEAGCDRIARMMGYKGIADFGKELDRTLHVVQRHYAELFEDQDELSAAGGSLVFTGDTDDPDTLETLSRLGYREPARVIDAIRTWHYGRYPATRSAAARERLTELVPTLLKTLAATDSADTAFLAFDGLVQRLPSGFQFFSIIAANPPLLDLLGQILGAAPKLADALVRRVHVLDAVLDPAFFGAWPSEAEVERRLAERLAEATGHEDILDRARIYGQEKLFLIGVRVLTGTLSVSQAGLAYASLATALVRQLLQAVEAEVARAHGKVPGGQHVVVALGKLGGREMTASSDLDLMLLYDAPETVVMSDGQKPLAVSQYYARLTQRLITALSAPTAQGTLYEVDFRLRPSGNKGPVATPLAGFVSYQADEAWTWEHMALTRARIIAGDETFDAIVNRAIVTALIRARDPATIRKDVLEMRETIADEKGTDDVWDLKQVAGGLVDIEFIAQYLMLVHGPADPDLFATTTATALHRLGDAGHLSAPHADVLLPAIRLYQHLTQILRLSLETSLKPREAPRGLIDLLTSAAELPNIETLEAHLRETEAEVRRVFVEIVGPVKSARR